MDEISFYSFIRHLCHKIRMSSPRQYSSSKIDEVHQKADGAKVTDLILYLTQLRTAISIISIQSPDTRTES